MTDSNPGFPGPRALGKQGPAHSLAVLTSGVPGACPLAGVFSLVEVLEDFNVLQFKMSKFRVEHGRG